jgi:1-acyl-sn-glycerol-3-phosphate acyltransferase
MAYRRGDPFVNSSLGFRLWSHFTYYTVLWAVMLVSWLIYHLKVEHRENLRHIRPALLVSNHTLLLDPGILATVVLPFRTFYTMLEETALIPALGTFVRLLGAVPIPEDTRQFRRFEKDVRDALHRRGLVHFFPEGECFLWNQEIQPFRPGVFLLAARLRVPVIPVAIVLHRRSWNGHASFRLFGRKIPIPPRATVIIGKSLRPDPPHQGSPASLRAAAESLRRRAMEEIQAMIDHEGGSKDIYRGQMPRIAGQAVRRR